MSNNDPLIVWEKWIDPFGQALEEAKWTDYDNEIETLDDIEYIDEEGVELKSIKAIATPMGIIPYNELTAPGHLFNFWVGHTNFDITKSIALIIEETPGIEILDIFTRYRFRIGIGKCFADNETMKNVNDRIYDQVYTKNE
jgi:hypothetical protein